MTKRVQILGHDFETANAFVGEEREITVDTDNWSLRLHDDATPGGWLIYNRDQNDARYQARSVELDGLLGWEPNERGIVTRLGPANYALRVITGTAANIGVVNGNGYDGEPTVSLLAVIASDHSATGDWIFTQPVTGSGGFVGDLTGNVVGNLTGNVTGNVVGNLTGNVTGNVTGNLVGGFDTRGSTIIMDDGQIDPAWIAGYAASLAEGATPVGGILMFSGATYPDNWFLCDGTNGTPDLRDKFIVAAGSTYAAGASGGAAVHSHSISIDSGGAHTHTATASDEALSIAQMPSHKHLNGVTDSGTDLFSRGTAASAITTPDSIDNNSNNGTIEGYTSDTGSGDTHGHTITVDSGGAHTHTGDTADGSTIPPYYALAFIMRGS